MDAYEATRIVFSRIQALDPENAPRIMGLLLIQDHGEKEMIRLAFGPENLLHSVILQARKDLCIVPTSTPSTPLSSPNPFSRHNSLNSSRLGTSAQPSPSSWPSPPAFSRSNSFNGNNVVSHTNINAFPADHLHNSDDLINEVHLQDQLSFLNDTSSVTANGFLPVKSPNPQLFYSDHDYNRSPRSGAADVVYHPNAIDWGNGSVMNGSHRRSLSLADFCITPEHLSGLGWKPCLYYARGYCKNGSSCRFQHAPPDEVQVPGSKLEGLTKSQTFGCVASSKMMTSADFTSAKSMNFLLQQQQQTENQRTAAAVAAALMLGGEDPQKFLGRSRLARFDYDGLVNPGSRQIYLTFPSDSTFREEDVSNYFNIYGPVQDVRIPYQQKRMFGFVTFLYPETVKLILAKGNPHFVCDARVLVKPYKEKGKVPDKKMQQQPSERVDFSASPTANGVDSRDAFDLHQLRARMMYNNSQEIMLRKKMEQQQQAVDLQQAIEQQGRRFMGLQMLDLKNRNLCSMSSSNPIQTASPKATATTTPTSIIPTHQQQISHEDECSRAVPFSGANEETSCFSDVSNNFNNDSLFLQESGVDHNLPDSPFASPTKSVPSVTNNNINDNNFPLGASSLDMTSIKKSCLFPLPSYTSSGGAVGL